LECLRLMLQKLGLRPCRFGIFETSGLSTYRKFFRKKDKETRKLERKYNGLQHLLELEQMAINNIFFSEENITGH